MSRSKIERIRLTLDLTKNDMVRAKKLEEIYETTSQADAVRTAIRHDLAMVEFIKAGGRIQHVKKDGTVETLVFTEWMPLM